MGNYRLLAVLLAFFIFTPAFAATDSAGVDRATGFSIDKLQKELEADAPAQVKDTANVKPYRTSGSREAVMLSLKMILYVTLIGALLYFILKTVRKNIDQRTGQGRSASRSIEVLEIAPLGPRKSVQLVRVAGRVLALGVSEDAVRTLAEFSDRESVDAILKNNRPTAPQVADHFSSSINHFLSRFRKKGPQSVDAAAREYDGE
ncbi:MAG: flagellar biosynthetic protein FliO [Fibrobacterota bacterium]